jgi:DNA invertase Pin-like site-specific DNA recombinase
MIVGYTCHACNDTCFSKLGAKKVIYEKKTDRQKLMDLIDSIPRGSTIIFYTLADAGRTVKELDSIIRMIHEKKINIVTIKSLRWGIHTQIDTRKDDHFFDHFLELTAYRKTKQSESINEGIKSSPIKGGRRRTHSQEKVSQALDEYYSSDVGWDDIAEKYNISQSTLYRAHTERKKNHKQ